MFKILNTGIMRVLALVIVCAFQNVFAFAQVPDSILSQIKTVEDQSRLIREYARLSHHQILALDPNALSTSDIYVELAIKYGKDRDLADAFHCNGMACQAEENHIKAITNFLQEQTIWEKLRDNSGLAEVYYNLGDCYRALFDSRLADEYLKRAYDQYEILRDSAGIGKALNRMAAINIDSYMPARIDEGYEQASRSQSIAIGLANYDLMIANYVLMGSYFSQKKEPEKSLEVLNKARKLIPMAKEKFHLALILNNIAATYYRAGNHLEAISYANLAYEDAINTRTNVYEWVSAWSLYLSYNALNRMDSANKYRGQALQARINIINEVMANQKNIYEFKYLKEKFRMDLESEKKQKNLIYVIWIISFLLVTTTVAFLYFRNKRLRLSNRLLSEQNKIIEEQKKELSLLTLYKDKVYSVIAHDLRSPFSGFIGLTEILADEMDTKLSPEHYKMVVELNKSAGKLHQLLENLLQWAQLQQGAIVAYPEHLPFSKMVDESLYAILEMAAKKDIALIIHIPEGISVFADRYLLESVLRNLTWNALKFTPRGGQVEISAYPDAGKIIVVEVSDSGIGMSPKILENLFHFDKTVNRSGTDGEPSSGLGLMICKEFIEKNGGKLHVKSEEGKGSTFTFTVPAS